MCGASANILPSIYPMHNKQKRAQKAFFFSERSIRNLNASSKTVEVFFFSFNNLIISVMNFAVWCQLMHSSLVYVRSHLYAAKKKKKKKLN